VNDRHKEARSNKLKMLENSYHTKLNWVDFSDVVFH